MNTSRISKALRWTRRYRSALALTALGGILCLSLALWQGWTEPWGNPQRDIAFATVMGTVLLMMMVLAAEFHVIPKRSRHLHRQVNQTARELDNLKAQHRMLERQVRHMRLVAEHAVEGIVITDLNHVLTFVNQAWARMHGYSRVDLQDCDITRFHTRTQLRNEVYAFFDQVLATGNYTRVLRHKRIDGSEFAVRTKATMFHDETGNPAGFLVYMIPPVAQTHRTDKERPMESQPNDPTNTTSEAIHSEYENTPSIAEILYIFIDSLAPSLANIFTAVQGSDYAEVAKQAHMLKGAGGGYGYPMITDAAAELEQSALQEDAEMVQRHVTKLAALCAAVERGRNASSPAGEET